MEEIGDLLMDLGLSVLPFSFAMYFPVRWLEYLWHYGHTRLIKGIWYLALGMTYVTGGVEVEYIVTFICFIEAWDLAFQQLEIQRSRRKK